MLCCTRYPRRPARHRRPFSLEWKLSTAAWGYSGQRVWSVEIEIVGSAVELLLGNLKGLSSSARASLVAILSSLDRVLKAGHQDSQQREAVSSFEFKFQLGEAPVT